MKLYFAGCQVREMQDAARICGVKNVLVSYYYLNENLKEFVESFGYEINLMLDSGGFSVRNRDRKINVSDYISFIKRNSRYIKYYFVLDNKREMLDETKHNLELMENEGLNPIPIYHTDEPFEYFKELCEKYPYIGVGGAEHNYRNIFSIANENNVRIHLLGNTSPTTLLKYKPYSADSVSWCSGGKFGHIYIFNGYTLKQFHQRKNRSVLLHSIQNEEFYKQYNVDFEDLHFSKEGRGDYYKMLIFNCLNYLKFAEFVNEGVL